MRTEKPRSFMPRFRVRRESGWKRPAMLNGSRECCESTITNSGSETRRRFVPPWCGSRRRTRAMPCTFSTCWSRTVFHGSGCRSPVERDLRQMLRHRQKLVRFRTSVMNQLHALAMGQGLCRRKKLWARVGRKELEGLVLDPWASLRRNELLQLLDQLDPWIATLDEAVMQTAESCPAAACLMQQAGVGPVTALGFVLTIGPVSRFANSKKLVSYLGLNPSEDSSAGRQRLGAISRVENLCAHAVLVARLTE